MVWPWTSASFLGKTSACSEVTTRRRVAWASKRDGLVEVKRTSETSSVPVSQPRMLGGSVICMPRKANEMFAL